jgi:hypothetical protein
VEIARTERVGKVLWRRRAVEVRVQVELGHGKSVRTRRSQRVRVDA